MSPQPETSPAPRAERRPAILVTGLGAVSAFGWGIEPLRCGLRAGTSAIGTLSRFDHARQRTHLAGEVPPPPRPMPPWARWPRLSHADRFAVAAAREAVTAAGLVATLPEQAGVCFGASTAGLYESEEYILGEARGGRPRPSLLASQQLNGPGDAVARHLGLSGPVFTVSSACASATLAIEAALRQLRSGEAEVALAGGADSLCRVTYSGFNALRAVDERPCRPYRAGRAGMSLGEGAGVLVLETENHALGRGARPLAVLEGAGSSCDAGHMTAPDAEGHGAALAIRRALRDAQRRPEDVGFVNLHGTGTPLNDRAEWAALRQVFGDCAGALPLTATKAATGHLLGAAGAIEAVATVLCLAAGEVHPTAGEGELDPELPVNLVRGCPLPLGEGIALSVNLAFGGANAALVFAPWRPE